LGTQKVAQAAVVVDIPAAVAVGATVVEVGVEARSPPRAFALLFFRIGRASRIMTA
jgi:hypothetical protein